MRRGLGVAAAVALLAVAAATGLMRGTSDPPAAPAAAGRVVSLVPAVTEMLFAIGAGAQVVAVSSFDAFPPEVTSLPRVGALLDPDTERILALRPDLVIVYGSQTDLQTRFERAGIRVLSYRHAGIDDVFDTMRAVGGATGRRDAAERVAEAMTSQLGAIRERVAGRTRPRVMLVFGRQRGTLREIYASGGRGFLHEMLEVAGGENVFGDMDRESVQPSTETVLARAPVVILEIQATGGASEAARAREAAVWSTLASVPAVRDGRIHFLTGDRFVVPGPRIASATEAIARVLHPAAF